VKIKKLTIQNFKSLININIDEPEPFTTFVGPNGSGKSNIFEAIQLAVLPKRFGSSPQSYIEWINVFGGYESIKPKSKTIGPLMIKFDDDYKNGYAFVDDFGEKKLLKNLSGEESSIHSEISNEKWELLKNCRRLFVGHPEISKIPDSHSFLLDGSGSNMINVLKRLLETERVKEEMMEWLRIFIPAFDNISVQVNALNGNGELAVYEKYITTPLPSNLISDGTKNILSILTAVYQSSEPQFLCIEEPENGLHPYVIKELVNLFRQQCEEKGHYIWLNTHSPTLVNQLEAKEIIVVNKNEGQTTIQQFKNKNFHGLPMDEAWLSNAMGGGVPW